jgi:NADH-quinone oxidoreductase subunit N
VSRPDLLALAPELVLTVGGVVLLLVDAVVPRARRAFTVVSIALAAVAVWAAVAWHQPGTFWNGLIESSGTTLAFSLVILASAVLCLLASDGYLRREGILAGEYHALLLWCAVGLLLMVRATELLTVFLCLELFSICLYSLAAYHRRIKLASEAAIKYFLMGAFVSGFVLFGIALVYGETGKTRLEDIGAVLAGEPTAASLLSLGLLLVVSGFAFKMSLVPFHAWSPDAYQGAPSPFVAFLSVAPKAASALVLFRLLEAAVTSGAEAASKWQGVVAALAVASMVVGNLLGLVQREIKRMLAYSGIAHMGYLVLALVTVDRASLVPVLVYLLAYVLMNAGAFTVVTMLYGRPGEQHLISDLSGLGYRYPLLGGCLAVCMLSLAGIPPTAGFLGKYLVFLNAVGDGHVGLAVIGVLASLVGVFYYLRVVYTLYMKSLRAEPEGLLLDVWGRAAAVAAALGSIVLGVWPSGLLDRLAATIQ